MAEQLERLSNINQGLRRNLSVQQERTNTLAKEKAAIQTEVTSLKQELGDIREQSQQSENASNEETSVVVNGLLNNNDDNSTNVDETHDKEKEEDETTPMNNTKDPNRPRFTRQELHDVLNERNQLKEEVLSLKEELAFYKPQYEYSLSFYCNRILMN